MEQLGYKIRSKRGDFSHIFNNSVFKDTSQKQGYFVLKENLYSGNLDKASQMIGGFSKGFFVRDCLDKAVLGLSKSNSALNHSLDLMALTNAYCLSQNYDKEKILNWSLGALFHDIGKSLLDPGLLNRPGKLGPEEYRFVQFEHLVKGREVLEKIGRGFPKETRDIVNTAIFEHPERVDGSGYPLGKKGDEISEFGRYLGIADTYQTLVGKRPYRKSLSPEEAVLELNKGVDSGKYDKNILENFSFMLFEEGILN